MPLLPPFPPAATIARLHWYVAMADGDGDECVAMDQEDEWAWASDLEALLRELEIGNHRPLTHRELEPLLTSSQARIRQDATTHLVPWLAL